MKNNVVDIKERVVRGCFSEDRVGLGRERGWCRCQSRDRGIAFGGDVRASEISLCHRKSQTGPFMARQGSSFYRNSLERYTISR